MDKIDEIGTRIEKLVKTFAGGKNTAFASQIGTNEANIRNYINGTLPKYDVLSKIVICFDVSAEWLLTGKGEMLKKDNFPEDIKQESTAEFEALLNRYEKILNENILLKKEIEDIQGRKKIGKVAQSVLEKE